MGSSWACRAIEQYAILSTRKQCRIYSSLPLQPTTPSTWPPCCIITIETLDRTAPVFRLLTIL
jgi:hypothetical protein